MSNFVDLHHHLVYGVDDGAQTLEDMQKMILRAAQEGVADLVCTTHVTPGHRPVPMENYQRHIEKGSIEIAPLAYMRGRTLDDCFIILDEAQNATPEQMKMFLTRLGFNSKAVITGDLTQTDLPFGQKSGLAVAVKILDEVDDIYVHAFTDKDVVRHKLVQQIIRAYEKYEKALSEKKSAQKSHTKQGDRK